MVSNDRYQVQPGILWSIKYVHATSAPVDYRRSIPLPNGQQCLITPVDAGSGTMLWSQRPQKSAFALSKLSWNVLIVKKIKKVCGCSRQEVIWHFTHPCSRLAILAFAIIQAALILSYLILGHQCTELMVLLGLSLLCPFPYRNSCWLQDWP